MKYFSYTLILCFFLISSTIAFAKTHTVNQDDNITNAINAAISGDTIRFYPGTYTINMVIENKTLTLEGADTKNTIFKAANTSLPIITFKNTRSSSIKNVTFLNANIGIIINDASTNIQILNNVFRVGVNNTALEIDENTSANISNNTFYGNFLNVNNRSTTTSASNNIFSNYDTLINGIMPSTFLFNCIDTNAVNLNASNATNTSATFVDADINSNDFHLQDNSDCRDMTNFDNTFDDAGAYGGASMDKTPDSMPIDSINADDISAIVAQWPDSKDYYVDGYKLYYHTEPIYSARYHQYTTLSDRNTFLSVVDTGETSQATLINLPTQAGSLLSPVLTNVLPGMNKLKLSWDAVENATSYTVYYETENIDSVQRKVGNTNSYEITGLTNQTPYTVWVVANNQLTYYFQVATYLNDDDTDFTESYFTKKDKTLDVGDPVISEMSNKITMQPEAIVAYPALPNEGCFIATAAYGHYSSTQVQTLRSFRDHYLLTNNAGRAFVDLYYQYSPALANVISQHAWLKSVTRMMLYPFILSAEFIKHYSLFLFSYILLMMAGLSSLLFYRRVLL